ARTARVCGLALDTPRAPLYGHLRVFLTLGRQLASIGPLASGRAPLALSINWEDDHALEAAGRECEASGSTSGGKQAGPRRAGGSGKPRHAIGFFPWRGRRRCKQQ